MPHRAILPMVFGSLALTVGPLAAAPRPRLASVADARGYLEDKYPARPSDPAAPFRYTGADITEVDAPILRKQLPRTRFFVTKLQTKHFEYWEVETLVSVSFAGDRMTGRDCFSPVYTTVSADFRSQFCGLRATSAAERRKLGEEIASLFKQITYKGELRNADFAQPRSSIELLTHMRHYRTIHFDFDDEGRLKSVTLQNPVTKEIE